MGRFPLDRLAIGLGKIFEVDRARTLTIYQETWASIGVSRVQLLL
jgi:hypothetical protein